MNRRMIFFCVLVVVAIASAAAAPSALADDPSHATAIKISVWPEYDKPTVLVMIDGSLADRTNLPREISVLVPSTANVVVTTYQNGDGTFAPEQLFNTADAGNGMTRISYTVKTADYHVEYYDDLVRGSPDKTVAFTFKAAAPADQVTIEVQQPLQAKDLSTIPDAANRRTENGFQLYDLPNSNVAAGQSLNVQIKYTKTDPNPSVAPTSAAPVPSGTAAPPATSSWTNAFFVAALVVLGLAAILGFMLIRQRGQMTVQPVQAPRSPSRRKNRRARAVAPAGASAYCTQCGRALGPEDHFCPTCGTKRRTV